MTTKVAQEVSSSFGLDYGKRRKERQEKERQERNKKWQSMSPQAQLDYLDKHLGAGKGAQKQRRRIEERLRKTENIKTPSRREPSQKNQPKPNAVKAKFRNMNQRPRMDNPR